MQSMAALRERGADRAVILFRRYLDEVSDNGLEPETRKCKVDEVVLDFGCWLMNTDSFSNGRYLGRSYDKKPRTITCEPREREGPAEHYM